ncbi:uncharacterized protein CXorf49 homolog [Suncus etruscus]|uniref:uncharacterized protein CXorf49 homolog n=1 Tax=Suncus etruscus TaxID=109475 RepID=UPI00210F647E|nr:uncharacterized protein CXorf49 homolog [Suncus etruscus]
MSSLEDEVTLHGGNIGLKDEDLARFRRTGLTVPSALGLGLNLGVPPRSKAGGGFQGPWGSKGESKALAVGEAVFYGQEGPLGTSANLRHDKWDDDSDSVALVPLTTQESGAGSMPQVLYPEAQDVERSPSPVSCWDEDSTPWRGLNSVSCARAPFPQGHGEARLPLANPRLLGVCKGGRGGRMIGRGSRGGWSPPRDKQGSFAVGLAKLPSEPESSGNFSELQRVRDGKTASREGASRGRGPTITHSPENSNIASGHFKFPWMENLLYIRGSTPPSLSRRGPTSLERRAVAGRDNSASKTLPNVVLGKGQDKSSYSGVSLTTSPPQTTAKMVNQDKKYRGGTSQLALGRAIPSREQKMLPATQEPANFPPIIGVKLPVRSEGGSMVPLPSKQPKQTGVSGKKSVARMPRVSEQVARDDDPKRDQSPKGQIYSAMPKQSGQRTHFAEGSSKSLSSLNFIANETPGNTHALLLNKRDMMITEPTHSAVMESLVEKLQELCKCKPKNSYLRVAAIRLIFKAGISCDNKEETCRGKEMVPSGHAEPTQKPVPGKIGFLQGDRLVKQKLPKVTTLYKPYQGAIKDNRWVTPSNMEENDASSQDEDVNLREK